AAVLPLRSNIPAISEFTFRPVDSTFVQRCKDSKGGFIVGGANYGQGSSREHAAIAPMYLGIKAVLALDIARIHHKNLINFGILPLTLASRRELKKINQDNTLELKDVHKIIKQGGPVQVRNVSKKTTIHCSLELSDREKQVLLKGGLLNFMRRKVRKLQC
ncbi:MAG: aconitate hydratase, partial [Candidatus Nanoarchaeia archaeon]